MYDPCVDQGNSFTQNQNKPWNVTLGFRNFNSFIVHLRFNPTPGPSSNICCWWQCQWSSSFEIQLWGYQASVDEDLQLLTVPPLKHWRVAHVDDIQRFGPVEADGKTWCRKEFRQVVELTLYMEAFCYASMRLTISSWTSLCQTQPRKSERCQIFMMKLVEYFP